jgi:hypothetical protein
MEFLKDSDGVPAADETGMIQTGMEVIHGFWRRVVVMPFIDVGIGVRGV